MERAERTRTAPRPVLTYADARIANAVFKAAKRDYQRPEIKADYERWKAEQAKQKEESEVRV